MRSSAPPHSHNPYAGLEGKYILHEELGSGGFGKVKLATHTLVGQKVAVKIIDKRAIGDDLPRVKTEMEALRTLSHQNICRLYEYIETEDKFFIAMEYCSGGEMFDYIVRKERLEESEARHFFRQLVQAIAYVHSMGFAHRDLKPENLLLTEDLHLKLIDFGLCARPDSLSRPLDTCCGSPAYAAPELIQGTSYLGNEADVWSMGVLLYALLVGALPFEDDSMQGLYKKISRGVYREPAWLTPCSRSLLKAMLQVQPSDRITVQELLVHPWLNKKYSQPIKWNTIYDKNIVDEDVARELAFYHRTTLDQMVNFIKEWRFDHLTSTYYLLLQQKRRGMKMTLPMPRWKKQSDMLNLICSPTIHASLDDELDKSGLEEACSGMSNCNMSGGGSSSDGAQSEEVDVSGGSDESDGRQREVRFAKPHSPDTSKNSQTASYARAMLTMPSNFVGAGSPRQKLAYESGEGRTGGEGGEKGVGGGDADEPTPQRQQHRNVRAQASLGLEPTYYSDKENTRAASVRVRGPVRVTEDCGSGTTRPRSIYSTPQRAPLKGLFSPSGNAGARQRARSTDRSSHASSGCGAQSGSCSPASLGDRTPRSATKTPRLRQRVFASLERKADKMITLLTPRKIRNDCPQVLKTNKGMVNVSMTSSKEPERIRAELVKVFDQQGMKYDVDGWKISGRQRNAAGNSLTVELEIVMIETLGFVGVKRRRLNGDAFMYKKVCEQVLKLAGL